MIDPFGGGTPVGEAGDPQAAAFPLEGASVMAQPANGPRLVCDRRVLDQPAGQRAAVLLGVQRAVKLAVRRRRGSCRGIGNGRDSAAVLPRRAHPDADLGGVRAGASRRTGIREPPEHARVEPSSSELVVDAIQSSGGGDDGVCGGVVGHRDREGHDVSERQPYRQP